MIPNPSSTTVAAMTELPLEIDRLSTLPDFILEDILSLLPTPSAAATSVLSRRWRHLWTRVTRFHLDSSAFSSSLGLRAFLTTVDSVLCRFDSFHNFRYFYLRFSLLDDEFEGDAYAIDFCSSFLNRWFGRVCNLHTERIDVDDCGHCGYFVQICVRNSFVAKTMCSVSDNGELESSNGVFCLPQCVFQSETLTELYLSSSFRWKLPEFVNLPNLKKLSMPLFDTFRDLMRTFFNSLPLLEDLTLFLAWSPGDHYIEISAPNLRIFTVKFFGSSKVDISIDAPKLKHISILSYSPLVLRFVKISSALSTVKLANIFLVHDPVNQILELLKGISCVRSLVISYPTINVLNCVDVEALPSFRNLTHLSLNLRGMRYTDDVHHVPTWILWRVNTIEATCLQGRGDREMCLLENILSKANVLERLCVSISDVGDGEIESLQKENEFVKALFTLPRVSSRCEIEFRGLFVRASTDGFQNGSITRELHPSI